MGDHLVVDVNRLLKPEISSGLDEKQHSLSPLPVGKSSASSSAVVASDERMDEANDEEAPLLTMAECRICQDEDAITNMESPCACSGSLKDKFRLMGFEYIHRHKSLCKELRSQNEIGRPNKDMKRNLRDITASKSIDPSPAEVSTYAFLLTRFIRISDEYAEETEKIIENLLIQAKSLLLKVAEKSSWHSTYTGYLTD